MTRFRWWILLSVVALCGIVFALSRVATTATATGLVVPSDPAERPEVAAIDAEFTPSFPLFTGEDASRPALVNNLQKTFGRPRLGSDVLPRNLRRSISGMIKFDSVASGHKRGPLVASESRQVLIEAGMLALTMYVAPTESGHLWYGFSDTRFTPRCVAMLSDAAAYANKDYQEQSDGTFHVIVHGFVADKIKGVDIRVGEDWRAATLTGNTFFLEVPSVASPDDVDELAVRFHSG